MFLDDLAEFIGTTYVDRDIEFKGRTHKFYFRLLMADEAEEFFSNIDKDPKKNRGLRNRLLSKIICDDKGGLTLKPEEAGKLPNELANKLQDAALEVNGLNKAGQDAAKNE
jgi:hypothetical protein